MFLARIYEGLCGAGAPRRRSPLQKLALAGDSSSLECFTQVSLCFSGYHCLRMGRHDLIFNRDIAQIAIELRAFVCDSFQQLLRQRGVHSFQ